MYTLIKTPFPQNEVVKAFDVKEVYKNTNVLVSQKTGRICRWCVWIWNLYNQYP